MRAFVLTLELDSLMKTKLYAIGNWNTWLLIPRGKFCFRSNAPEELVEEVEEVLVTIDEGEIPVGFGMYDHRESSRDS